jgi:5-methylcytosine-specific restriction enzyme B
MTRDDITREAPIGWLFQANPRRYDIYTALRRYSELSWSVSQHRESMHGGDAVYLWASGLDGGIIAAGTILDEPRERDPTYNAEDDELWAEGAAPEPGGWEVPLRLRALDPSISRAQVLAHSVLREMTIFRAPQMTNYRLTNEQHEAVQALLNERTASGATEPLADLIAEWKASLGEPWPTREASRHLDMRARFQAMLAADRLDPNSFDIMLFRQFTVGNYGGPGPQSRLLAYLKESGESGVTRLLDTFRHLLYSDGPVEQRLDDVLESGQWRVRGLGESLAVKALAVTDPGRFIPLMVFWSGSGHGKLDFMRIPALGLPPFDESGLTRGEKAVQSNDLLCSTLEPYLGDDTHAMSWFLWWLADRRRENADLAGTGIIRQSKEDLAALAMRLLLPPDWLQEVIELLYDKRQVIFYGPPGTGKTYIARELQRYLAPDPLDRRTVQFHPSYAYEDFVEGYRPVGGADGQPPSFQIQRGPLLELVERAEQAERAAVLLIDEINRGNLAKVFGELYYLLEYRDAPEMKLQYSEGLVVLPESLYIIGTMNTADRSITLVDGALRRRFHFVPFHPDEAPIKGLLRNWLKANSPSMTWVADLVDRANARLDRHLQIGPSHFMRKDLDDKWVRLIWRYTVLPYIEEQYFDDYEQLAAFDIDQLRADPSLDQEADPHAQQEAIPDNNGDAHRVDTPDTASEA